MPHRRLASGRVLATVLFTDIVESTQHAAELGDRRWRDLLERHNAVVRRRLKEFHGREVATLGDGFFALFEAPEEAVRCAESITSSVRPLGLQVRVGVHMGECEVIGGEVGGMAVHIGARVAALAGAGEVLVSGSVRDVMTGSERRFDGGEPRQLKGVAEPWRVYQLVPEEVDGDSATSLRSSMLPLFTRPQRRRTIALMAVLLLVAVTLPAGYLLIRLHGDPDVVVEENAVGMIGGPEGSRVGATVLVGHRPTALAADQRSVWVTISTDNTVSRIDRRAPATSVPSNLGAGSSPSGVAVGAGHVWVATSGNATVSKIDPDTSLVTTIRVGSGPTGIVAAFGSVWVANTLDASVTELDPTTNTVVSVVPVGANPTGIAAGAGYLWVTNHGDGTVTRFDPRTHVKDPPIAVGSGPIGIAVGVSAAWVANNLDGSLSRIDVEDLKVTTRTLAKRGGAYGVAALGDRVWVSNEYDGTLLQITSQAFDLAAIVRLGGAPLGLAFVGDDLWFTSSARGVALHRGGTLTMVGTAVAYDGDPPFLDPTLRYDEPVWRLATLTNDGLVGLRRTGGVEGTGLVPDLAVALPTPTDGGRTYTFHVRKGVRYSTGAPVLAGDIRRGIERAVVHPDTAADYYASAILGANACQKAAQQAEAASRRRPDCDLSEGITADDGTGTVSFHLTRPTPEFPYQLTLPSASLVPQRTPVDLTPGATLPATGPYMIRSYAPQQHAANGRPARRGRLELVRNPHFQAWSPPAQPAGYPDRIVLETGYTEREATQRVVDGRADLLWSGVPPTELDRLRTRNGPQLHTSTGAATNFVFLNATKPPFDNQDARRAVAFALDRAALSGGRNAFSGPVTCQVIPPNFAAYRPYCPFTLGEPGVGIWSAPDVSTAQDLVKKSGTRGAEVVLVVDDADPASQTAGRLVVKVLRALGYRASLRVYPLTDWFDVISRPSNKYNAGVLGWVADYPAPSNYLVNLASCNPELHPYNVSGYCDPAIETRIAAALKRELTDPATANDIWATIDRAVVDAAATIPFGNNLRQDLVSRRVGNVLVHPVTGPIISQMWVH